MKKNSAPIPAMNGRPLPEDKLHHPTTNGHQVWPEDDEDVEDDEFNRSDHLILGNEEELEESDFDEVADVEELEEEDFDDDDFDDDDLFLDVSDEDDDWDEDEDDDF